MPGPSENDNRPRRRFTPPKPFNLPKPPTQADLEAGMDPAAVVDDAELEREGGEIPLYEREDSVLQAEAERPSIDVSGLERKGREAEEAEFDALEMEFPARP